ncbi:MAG: Trk system potassium transporter TrkA [Planctomycetales bacterium]|nr:Trk system potassium transporter TrkA [Planctomycetales bacterium]
MRIVILGAGTVGSSIAEMLCGAGHAVTVIDSSPEHSRRINDELDVLTLTGSASQSSVLFQAGVMAADIVLAVTGDDEVNIVAASMAKAMGARRSIARVYAPVFRDLSTFDYQRHFGIDRLLSLEHLTAMELASACRHPGAVVVDHLARGGIEIQEITLSQKCNSTKKPLRDLGLPSNVRIGAIHREGRVWLAHADDQLQSGDRIALIGTSSDVESIKGRFHTDSGPRQRVAIAGGGETGYHLAKALEKERFSVYILEASAERCAELANNLGSTTTIIHADATRRAVLEEERIGGYDIFVACTGDDENNILAGVEAREFGAKRIMAVVGRPDYANIVNKLGIDFAVSEREVMAKKVMSFLNVGPVVSRTALTGSDIRILEIEVHNEVPATKRPIVELQLPPRSLLAALSRQDFISVPTAKDQLQPGDTLVALVEHDQVDPLLELFKRQRG